MLGLALEGGGAKGAFHMGAAKALLEEGYTFDVIAGTSIGAFNAAILTQGDFELGYSLWENMTTSMLFDIEDTKLQNILSKKVDLDTIAYVTSIIKELITNKGIDTGKIKELLDSYIDEAKIRASHIDLGIITVSLSDLKPLELYKNDIPDGKLTAYLMASANFPIFKLEPLAGKYFVDGGVYDNCPINLLIRKGCDKIIAVRTFSLGISQKPMSSDAEIISVHPSEDLGKILVFDNAMIRHNLKMGYYDTKKALHGLKGNKYYIHATGNDFFLKVLLQLPKHSITTLGHALSLNQYIEMEPTRLLFEKILPKLCRHLKLEIQCTYEDIVLSLLELVAEIEHIERFHIYTLNEFVDALIPNTIPEKLTASTKHAPLRLALELTQLIAKTLNMAG